MRVLIDTNIILDQLLEREPFVSEAEAVFEAIESQRIEGFVTATTLTNIFYIVRKGRGIEIARQAVSRILASMQVCTVNRSILEAAASSNLSDFEDAVQEACAMSESLDGIVTRDRLGFAGSPARTISPSELLQLLDENSENSS